jgi:hypothetical protein
MRYRGCVVSLMLMAVLSVVSPIAVTGQQNQSGQQKQSTPANPVAKRSDLFCTGFISETEPRVGLQIVGAEKENSKRVFSQGDIVYLNQGRKNGIQSGAVYYVIRPLGEVRHPATKTRLGIFVRELGLLRVIEVQDQTSTAEITVSCDTIEMGDMVKPYEAMESPNARQSQPLPRYSESNGRTTGQIILSPNMREYLSANQVVLLDIGNRQGVQAGDYFTIFRPVGESEGVTKIAHDNVLQRRNGGFESDRYHGGDFSSLAPRVPEGEVLKTRPPMPRKVVGELVVLRVDNIAAVALITRTNCEVNIGDYVERMD